MKILMILATIISFTTITYGVRVIKGKIVVTKGSFKNSLLKSVSAFGIVIMGIILSFAFKSPVFAEPAAEAAGAVATGGASLGDGLKYIAAALSTGLATIGTGVAVGSVGSSALGAVSEDPTILGKTLIFVGMAEGIAIYGMIISILILFV